MQKVDGYICFENCDFLDVKNKIKTLNPNLEIFPFRDLIRNGNFINTPGIYISGYIDSDMNSKDVALAFRGQLNLNNKYDCDISTDNEDLIKEIEKEKIMYNFFGLKLEFLENFKEIEILSLKIAKKINANNITIRQVEKFNNKQLYSIDLFAPLEYGEVKNRIKEIIKNSKLNIFIETFFKLE